MIRVVLADDHKLFTDGLQRLLTLQDDIEVVAVESSGTGAIEALRRETPDLLLLDIAMPDINAFAVIDALNDENVLPKVILVTMHSEPSYLLAASRPDVQGYVLKDAAFDELIEAIRTVYEGGRFVSASLKGAVTERCPLTNRELDVLRCAARGLTMSQTADALGIGAKTVETHRAHIMDKLNAANIATAIHTATRAEML